MTLPTPLIPDDAPLITGIGAVSPHGQEAGALFEALLSARPRIDAPDWPVMLGHQPPKIAMHVRGFAPEPWVKPMALRRLDNASKFATVAAALALADAKLDGALRAEAAIACGTATLGTVPLCNMLGAIWGPAGPDSCNPSDFPVTVANSAGGQIAILHGLRGPNLTLAQKECSGLAALNAAGFLIVAGLAERVLVVGCDDFPPEQAVVQQRLGVLARAGVNGPFSAGRSGTIGGEGAYALLLESPAAAARRGARPLARLRAWGEAHLGGPQHAWPRDPAPLAELFGGLAAAGAPGAILASANGSRLDTMEAAAIARAWPAGAPAVTSVKWGLGECGAASLGAALVAVCALNAGALPPIHHTDAIDPKLPPLDFVTGAPRPLPPGPLLVSAISHGGAACAALLEKVSPDAASAPF